MKHFFTAFLSIGLVGFTACSDDEERFPISTEIIFDNGNGTLVCTCRERDYLTDDDVTYGYTRTSPFLEEYTEKGNQCATWGYTLSNSDDLSRDYNTRSSPGPNGYFGGGIPGSIPSYCSTGYQSPTSDVQLNTLCQTAWAYRCSGNKAAADLTCTQYKNIAQSGTPVNCPYCN